MSLSLYRKKRNFNNTPEPGAVKKRKNKVHSFVVQRHDASHLHYDFRLEMDGVLKSWAVPKGPSMKAGERRLAVKVEDHPLSYGKFQGEIPKGNYGAGTVEIWDKGTYQLLENAKNGEEEKLLHAQLKQGNLKFILKGKHLKGAFALVRLNDDKENNWLLIKKKDEYSLNNFKIEAKKSQKTKAKKKVRPLKIIKDNKRNSETTEIDDAWQTLKQPMLAKLTDKLTNDQAWLYEMKYDGYRAITKIKAGKVEMVSRNGNSFNKQFEPLVKEFSNVEDDIILDGEVVIENEHGVSNFQLLQNFVTSKKGLLKYFIFDILFLNGHRLTNLSLLQRKELLDDIFIKYKFKNIIKSDFVIEKGEALKKLSDKGHEGIIAKLSEGHYFPGKRSNFWLKVKNVKIQETIICGYTLPQNSRKHFGSIILGLYENKILKYIGNCGTGFTDLSLKELYVKFEKLITNKCPFEYPPVMKGAKGKSVWLKPVLVCNVKYLEWTRDGSMRNPVFMGLRTDKDPLDVIREKPEINLQNKMENNDIIISGKIKIKTSNLNKIYWPKEGITKGDVIDYYQRINKYILPYLKDRPQSLNRHPNGINGQSFYQKDMDVKQLPSWVKTAKMYSKSNKKYINYLVCNDAATLIYMANLGCIEINPWHSKFSKPDNPSYMMLDLDPGDNSFVDVINTALTIKEICDENKITCYCKTSGATGVHIYIPLSGKYSYDQIKVFAEILAALTHERLPNITSIERTVSKRRDKIYVDFLQNRKGQTIAAPYSLRPRPHATVSTPLMWKEVNDHLTPEMFTIHNIEKRLNKVGDLWSGVLGRGINLSKILKSLA